MEDHAKALADAVVAAVPGWVEASVRRVAGAAGVTPDPEAVAAACRGAAEEVGRRLGALVATDVDEQRTTPLSVVRAAVRWPAGVLAGAGVAPVERDAWDAQRFPDDVYGLTPAALADLDPDLAELAIVWGAAKAWEHRRRHLGT